MMVLTGPQNDAVTFGGTNMLVSAAAGSGKTAVLVERVIRRITDASNPVDIDRFLIVTFTNAAASEMRERIGSAIIKAMESADADSVQQRLQRQLVLLNHASICTIHSFCLDVIRNNVHLLDIDPGFRISDEAEAELIKAEAMEELLEKTYDSEPEQPGNPFYGLIEAYSGSRDDVGLQRYIMELYKFASSNPYPDAWLLEKAAMFNVGERVDFAQTQWGIELLAGLRIEIAGLAGMLARTSEQADKYPELDGYRSCLRDDIAGFESLLDRMNVCDEWDDIQSAISSLELGKLPPRRKAKRVAAVGADICPPADGQGLEKDAESVKRVRESAKKKLKELRRDIYGTDSKQLTAEIASVYPLMDRLARLVIEFGSIYSSGKKARKVIDFNDIEHYCLKLLSDANVSASAQIPSMIARSLRERFDEIMVDEYQDSNLIQESIIRLVSRCGPESPGLDRTGSNIFMVGDVKQSIYRFREARPELFLEKYQSYADITGFSPADAGVKIVLGHNFRSRSPILDGINRLFRRIMCSEAGELEYDDKEALYPAAVFGDVPEGCEAGGAIELAIISKKDDGSTETGTDMAAGAGVGANAGLGAGFSAGIDTGADAGLDAGTYTGPGTGTDTGTDINTGTGTGAGAGADAGVGVGAETGIGAESDAGADAAGADAVGTDTSAAGADGEAGADAEELDTIRLEARYIANRIKRIAYSSDFRIWDRNAGCYRKAMFRDIAVLMRSTKDWAEVFAEELSLQGIPVFTDVNTGYFKALEIRTMLALLQVIDNPLQDIPLLAVLRSPIVGMSLDELTGIRIIKKGACFFDALKAASDSGDASLGNKVFGFIAKLEKWRDRAQLIGISELIWEIFSETGYYSYCGAMPGGVQRQANLRILYERARKFEETSYRGLFNFIDFIDKFRMNRGDMGSARVLSENEDVVRIMSIHKSKGLEFPVVILAGCARRFNMQDLNRGILFHHRLGLGPEFVDLDRRIRYPTAAKLALKSKLRLEALSEEMRLLYVAMTRARERLILVGTVNSMEASMEKWEQYSDEGSSTCDKCKKSDKLPIWRILGSLSFLDWIGKAIIGDPGTDTSWKVTAVGRSDIETGFLDSAASITLKGNIAEQSEIAEVTVEGIYKATAAEISARLDWEYRYPGLSKIPAKVTVTELKRLHEASGDEYADVDAGLDGYASARLQQPLLVKRPGFLDAVKGLTAAEKGTVLHYVMQHLDPGALANIAQDNGTEAYAPALKDEVSRQTAMMFERRMLTPVQASAVDIDRIAAFFTGGLGQRMLRSKHIRKEIPFTIGLPYDEVFPGADVSGADVSGADVSGADVCNAEERVIVQGMIDCFFEEAGGFVLLDYKTDYTAGSTDDDIRLKYRLQMDYYKRAVEMLTGATIISRFIYLFHDGRTITL